MNITQTYKQALQAFKQHNNDRGQLLAESIIGYVAQQLIQGEITPEQPIEGVVKDVWLERCWGLLESNKLLQG